MEASRFEFDSEGDAEIVLRRPSKPNSFWPTNETKRKTTDLEQEPNKSKKLAADSRPEHATDSVVVEPSQAVESPEAIGASTSVVSSKSVEGTAAQDLEPTEIRMRVSTKHLSLASPFFRKMFSGPWGKSLPNPNGLREIQASGWNVDAFVTVMDMIHGRYRKVPKSVSPNMLCHLAFLTNYYQCHEVTEHFTREWLLDLENGQDLPKSHGNESMLYLFVSWVFRRPQLFREMSSLAMHKSTDPLITSLLPLPKELLGMFTRHSPHPLTDGFTNSRCSRDG